MTAEMNYKTFLLCLFTVFMTAGCATHLPDVRSMLEDVPAGNQPPEIIGIHSPVPPHESAEIMERLKEQGQTDILDRHVAAMELVTASPLVEKNSAFLLIDGLAAYEAARKAIEAARDNINWETYILGDGEAVERLGDLLLKKKAEGVQVNLIYDSFGSLRTHASFLRRLREGGINVLEFNPLSPFRSRGNWDPIYRDHRKVLIVDGKTAITGGVNIGSEFPWPGSGDKEDRAWRDTDVEIRGPAVAEFQKLFIETWQRQKGPKLPERDYFPPPTEEGEDLVRVVGSTPGAWNRTTYIMYVSAFTFAGRSIHLTNAYFVPDRQMIEALEGAAERGVDVKIILPDSSDFNFIFYAGRYYYSELLKAGIKLYERQRQFLHAKTAVIDGVWSTVGSANMDRWSFAHNDEENAVIVGRDFASEMEGMFSRDLSESKEILPGEWERRSALAKLREWFFHLFAPMF